MKAMENNIIEGNTAIAEFMGIRYHDNGTVSHYPSVLNLDMGVTTLENMRFHKSWDQLMPVLEKIIAYEFPNESDLPFGPDTAWLRTFGMIDDETGNVMVRFNRFGLHEAKTLIEATWQAVVQFINWHNQNQSK